MKKLIKNFYTAAGLLALVLVLSGCSSALPNPFAKNDSSRQVVTPVVDQPSENRIDITKNNENKIAAAETPSSAEQLVKPSVSVADVLKDVKNPFDCGQTCKDASCKEIRDCLAQHAADCLSTNGKVVYPIANSDKKKAIQHIIIGKVENDCLYKGISVTNATDINTPTLITFECKKPAEVLKQMFADGNFEKFVVANCSGTYVDFLKTKIN